MITSRLSVPGKAAVVQLSQQDIVDPMQGESWRASCKDMYLVVILHLRMGVDGQEG
jgi:hypothetical protein